MGTTLKVKLTQASIQNAIKEIEQYRGSLETRTRVLVGRLAEMGLDVAKARISESELSSFVTVNVNYQNQDNGCRAMLIATGQNLYSAMDEGHVNAFLLIEFGAGVAVNPTDNPLSGKYGYGVGTYGKGHGNDPNGWWFLDVDGKWHHTYGTRATMPMFKAYDTLMNNIYRVAREVFTTDRVVVC